MSDGRQLYALFFSAYDQHFNDAQRAAIMALLDRVRANVRNAVGQGLSIVIVRAVSIPFVNTLLKTLEERLGFELQLDPTTILRAVDAIVDEWKREQGRA